MLATPPDLSPAERAGLSRAAQKVLCRRSFPYFLGFIGIRSDDPLHPGDVALQPYPYQVELATRWQAHESHIILKSRQIGCSVLLRAYALWRAMYSDWTIGYYSRGQDEAVSWLDGVQAMADALPAHLKPSTRRSGDLLRIGAGSIRVFPGSQRGGVSYTFQLVVADEAAHHPYGRENYANYAPTLSAGGQYICLSTADPSLGPSGWFYEMWTAAKNATVPYLPVFLGWMVRTGRDAAWLATRRAEYAGNDAALLANYPEEPEQAFQGREGLVYGWDAVTGRAIFDRQRLVQEPLPLTWGQCRWRVVAIDPGGSDPTAIVPLGVGSVPPLGDTFIVPGLFYRRGAVSAQDMSEWMAQLHAIAPIDIVFVDPSQASLVATLRSLGWNAHPANNAKLDRISAVSRMMLDGRILFSPLCEPLFHEMETYWWPPHREMQAGGRASETRTGAGHHADAADALGYAVLGVIKGLPRNSGAVGQEWQRRDGVAAQKHGILEQIQEQRRQRVRGAQRAQPAGRP